MRSAAFGLVVGLCAATANAHLAIFTKGMWCENGADGTNVNSDDPVLPLYELEFDQWWFHAVNGCKNRPPADGEMMELPAGQSITVEIAANQGKSGLSFGGQYATDWPDGGNYPDDYNVPSCITSPNMHTQNQSMAAGTALAISYQSDINNVTPENLAVFSVRYHTPWKRLTTYDIPADLPPCPEGGCICSWGWIPNGCGQANMYHEAIRCTVTGSTSTKAVAAPQKPVWCEDDQSKCVQGSKQMLYWNQASGNNIEVDGFDLAGEHKSPGYNAKCGFSDGAQNDIFGEAGSASSAASSSSSSSTSAASSSSSAASTDNKIVEVSISSSGSDSNANPGSSSDSSAASSPTWSSTADATTWSSTAEATPSSTYEAPTSSSYTPTSAASSSSIASAAASASTPARKCRKRETPVKRAEVPASHRRHRRTHGHELY